MRLAPGTLPITCMAWVVLDVVLSVSSQLFRPFIPRPSDDSGPQESPPSRRVWFALGFESLERQAFIWWVGVKRAWCLVKLRQGEPGGNKQTILEYKHAGQSQGTDPRGASTLKKKKKTKKVCPNKCSLCTVPFQECNLRAQLFLLKSVFLFRIEILWMNFSWSLFFYFHSHLNISSLWPNLIQK